ncbi:ATP-binding protein [Streptomyces sp. NBC_01268]|uniref:ATP-binding protein n=1 Tax=unclassified Streptomyces TaxID=2593676 RepID=UPI002E36E286|nr:ATP-binding protein [Streptomyces sp. NBC_01268]
MVMHEEPSPTDRSLRYDIVGGTGVVAECRDLARTALDTWFGAAGEPGREHTEDVLLLVSEVVTNACTHGGVPYELRMDRRGGAVWVQVSDTSPVRPRPHGPHRANRSSGHGLYLLQRLSTRWGSVPRGSRGKTVWFEVEVLPRTLPQAAPPGRP